MSSPYGVVAVSITDGTTTTLHYLHTDYLGSVVAISNTSGVREQEMSYDAWGRRRNPDTWGYDSLPDPSTYLVNRGFTFHEHYDILGLINMNGRVYDPVVGRFLSVDPLVGNPLNAQDYNGYSYCGNNPLKYIDPTGFVTEMAYTTNDPSEIAGFLNHVASGGGVDNYNYSSWSETTVSNDNLWGIIVIGSDNFIQDVSNALRKIDQSHIGHIVLNIIAASSNTHPLYIQSSLLSVSYDTAENKGTIDFAGVVFWAGIQAQNYFDTNLGHELWHAFQDRMLGGKYRDMQETHDGKMSLERGAIAFENYLASVFYGEDYVRHNYIFQNLWDKTLGMNYFNKMNERVSANFMMDSNGHPGHFLGWSNNLTLTTGLQNYYQNLATYWLKP